MRSDGGKSIQLHTEFLAAVQDPETFEAAVACAKGQGWPASTVVNADLNTVIQSVTRSRPPAIIMADIDGSDDPAAMVMQLVKVCGQRSKVLTIGSANDIAFYRNMVQAGAADYLVKPLNSVTLRDAVIPLLASKDADKGEKKTKAGRVYVVVGVRGGVGATTLAVNAAWIMAHELNQKTALVDLDLQYGNCDLALDLEPARGLREVLSSPDRMDSLLINSSMSKESDNLAVFCCEDSLEEVVDFDTSGPLALLKELRGDYDHIVIDMPRALVPRHRRMLVSADHVVLVTDLTLGGIRDSQRIISAITNLGNANPIHVVAGRIGDGEAQVSRATFERSAKAKIEVLIPHDPKTVKLSANKGKPIPVVGEAAALARAMRQVTGILTGQSVASTTEKSGFLGGLFGKKG
jgi:pilus assembly protein CpaE